MALSHTPDAYVSDGHVVLTGPIQGTVTMADGTVVDVSAPIIEVPSPEHADEIADLIGQRYAAEGHPKVDGQFTYVGPEAV
jgi:hypothetical protein